MKKNEWIFHPFFLSITNLFCTWALSNQADSCKCQVPRRCHRFRTGWSTVLQDQFK